MTGSFGTRPPEMANVRQVRVPPPVMTLHRAAIRLPQSLPADVVIVGVEIHRDPCCRFTHAALGERRVLVVEDEPNIRELVMLHLKPEGLAVVPAGWQAPSSRTDV